MDRLPTHANDFRGTDPTPETSTVTPDRPWTAGKRFGTQPDVVLAVREAGDQVADIVVTSKGDIRELCCSPVIQPEATKRRQASRRDEFHLHAAHQGVCGPWSLRYPKSFLSLFPELVRFLRGL